MSKVITIAPVMNGFVIEGTESPEWVNQQYIAISLEQVHQIIDQLLAVTAPGSSVEEVKTAEPANVEKVVEEEVTTEDEYQRLLTSNDRKEIQRRLKALVDGGHLEGFNNRMSTVNLVKLLVQTDNQVATVVAVAPEGGEVITLSQMQEALGAVSKACGPAQAVELITKRGAVNLTSVDPSEWAAMIEECNALAEGAL